MKYLWTEDTGAGLHFWKLVNQLFFDDALVVESKPEIDDGLYTSFRRERIRMYWQGQSREEALLEDLRINCMT